MHSMLRALWYLKHSWWFLWHTCFHRFFFLCPVLTPTWTRLVWVLSFCNLFIQFPFALKSYSLEYRFYDNWVSDNHISNQKKQFQCILLWAYLLIRLIFVIISSFLPNVTTCLQTKRFKTVQWRDKIQYSQDESCCFLKPLLVFWHFVLLVKTVLFHICLWEWFA